MSEKEADESFRTFLSDDTDDALMQQLGFSSKDGSDPVCRFAISIL